MISHCWCYCCIDLTYYQIVRDCTWYLNVVMAVLNPEVPNTSLTYVTPTLLANSQKIRGTTIT